MLSRRSFRPRRFLETEVDDCILRTGLGSQNQRVYLFNTNYISDEAEDGGLEAAPIYDPFDITSLGSNIGVSAEIRIPGTNSSVGIDGTVGSANGTNGGVPSGRRIQIPASAQYVTVYATIPGGLSDASACNTAQAPCSGSDCNPLQTPCSSDTLSCSGCIPGGLGVNYKIEYDLTQLCGNADRNLLYFKLYDTTQDAFSPELIPWQSIGQGGSFNTVGTQKSRFTPALIYKTSESQGDARRDMMAGSGRGDATGARCECRLINSKLPNGGCECALVSSGVVGVNGNLGKSTASFPNGLVETEGLIAMTRSSTLSSTQWKETIDQFVDPNLIPGNEPDGWPGFGSRLRWLNTSNENSSCGSLETCIEGDPYNPPSAFIVHVK